MVQTREKEADIDKEHSGKKSQSFRSKAIRYVLLPGFLPRISGLLTNTFGRLAVFIAWVFQTAGLLPRNHPYLQPGSYGHYGIRHVIAEAGANLVYDKKHIDQILIFYTIVAGLIVLAVQFLLFIVAVLSMPVFASAYGASENLFVTANPTYDLAHILLDSIFGIPEPFSFDSCVAQGIPCSAREELEPAYAPPGSYPWPIHLGLHALLEFYSYAVAGIGLMIFLYFVATVAAETAVHGTPFGKRFNKTWVPFRCVLFLLIIMPTVDGLSFGQLAVMQAARFGSALATNAYLYYNERMGEEASGYLGDQGSLLAMPGTPKQHVLLQFMQIAHACKYAARLADNNAYIQPYIIKSGPIDSVLNNPADTARYLYKFPANDAVTGPEPGGDTQTDYTEAIEFSENGNIVIRFGEYNPTQYSDYKGLVKPVCGELTLVNGGDSVVNGEHTGSYIVRSVQSAWYVLIQEMWRDDNFSLWGSEIARSVVSTRPPPPVLPDADSRMEAAGWFNDQLLRMMTTSVEDARTEADFSVDEATLKYGWVGLSLIYHRFAQMNGDLVKTIFNVPVPTLYPESMEKVAAEKERQDESVGGGDRFSPVLGNGAPIEMGDHANQQIFDASYKAYRLWEAGTAEIVNPTTTTPDTGDVTIDLSQQVGSTPSPDFFLQVIDFFLGTSGLYSMRDNENVHPLAQITAIGRALIESSIRNFMMTGLAMGMNFLGNQDEMLPQIGQKMSSVFSTFGLVGLLAGFMLYYVLPILPFIYFLFALLSWIKCVFEAMVGIPLWALAHLRIDSEGLPGEKAMNGYFLMFEIFLRPVLIVVGFLLGVIFSSTMVDILNDIFDLVVTNLAGFDRAEQSLDDETWSNFRDQVDQFVFTIMYAVIVYMLLTASFKLTDEIPNQILRWLGSGVPTMNEAGGSSASEMEMTVRQGTNSTLLQLGEIGSTGQAMFMGGAR